MNRTLRRLLNNFGDDKFELFYSNTSNCWLYRNKAGVVREPYPYEEGHKLNEFAKLNFNNDNECRYF